TALSPSALSARGPGRAAAFRSWERSFIAARSSSENPSDVLATAVVLLADFCVFFAWVSLPGAFFSDISVSFLVAFRRRPPKLTCPRRLCGGGQVQRLICYLAFVVEAMAGGRNNRMQRARP